MVVDTSFVVEAGVRATGFNVNSVTGSGTLQWCYYHYARPIDGLSMPSTSRPYAGNVPSLPAAVPRPNVAMRYMKSNPNSNYLTNEVGLLFLLGQMGEVVHLLIMWSMEV